MDSSRRVCGACRKSLDKGEYSGKQWKSTAAKRRCRGCVDEDRPLGEAAPCSRGGGGWFDPRTLSEYVGDAGESFKASFTMSEMMGKMVAREDTEARGETTATADWKDSLFSIASSSVGKHPRHTKWQLQDRDQSEAILLEVIMQPAKVAPQELTERKRADDPEKVDGDDDGDQQALLVVRYNHMRRADLTDAQLRDLMKSVGPWARASDTPPCQSKTASKAQLALALQTLKSNQAKLSAGYGEAFLAQSPLNKLSDAGPGLFQPSFVVPPRKAEPREDNVCAMCASPAPLTCSKCKAAHYCGRDCQRRHWKRHKPVCKKTAADIRESDGAAPGAVVPHGIGGGQSIVVDIEPRNMQGMHGFAMSAGSLQPGGRRDFSGYGERARGFLG